ncbi:MAG: succinyl-diaminopimelate desuccinylase [Gammaproteobacteria bacterium]|nr:succinyl-diaminopimelate desuccinylase [Gammaproteobacteria bacterium]
MLTSVTLSATLLLAKQLIAQPSITPNDAQCQTILEDRLQKMSFKIEKMNFGEVKNFYARRGNSAPVLLFAGHTDVVPPGPLDKWTSPPFEPTIRNGALYGRGAADMKSSLAAMVCACEQFIEENPRYSGSIAFLITSDEEGPSTDGTKRVVAELLKRNENINWCIVGEASSENKFGDVIKVGRRGSLNGTLKIHGKQGHIAYPQKADNPIHKSLAALNELTQIQWDQGNEYFPPTSFQISNLHSSSGATNVIPGELEAIFNFRFGTPSTVDGLKQQVLSTLNKHGLKYDIDWKYSGEPFFSQPGELFNAATAAIEKVAQIKPRPSTDGGTSDGRFIFKTGCEILEIGPINQSIHQINEHINVKDLDLLTQVYYEILTALLAKKT